jgi:hypothetical protein
MESIRAKKVAAAVVAVLQYAAENELAAPPAPEEIPPKLLAQAAPVAWGLSGRQEAMEFRVLWQRRLAKSW